MTDSAPIQPDLYLFPPPEIVLTFLSTPRYQCLTLHYSAISMQDFKHRDIPVPIQIHCGYVPGAIGRLLDLHGRYYSDRFGWGVQFEVEIAAELAAFFKRFNPDHDGFWVAMLDKQKFGGIAIVFSDAQTARLRWFIIDPNYHGQGLGRSLMQVAIDFCQSVGFDEIYLWTAAGLPAAHHLYRQFGFSLVETVIDDRWGGQNNHQKFICALSPVQS